MILKVTHNIRIDKDMNISLATEGVVDDEEEATTMGATSAKIMQAYMASFGQQFGNDEDEDDE
jgi:hypothetical protein